MVRHRLENTLETANTGSSTPGATKAAAGPLDVLIIQGFLPFLAAQTFSGNFRGHFRCQESNGAMDATAQCVVRVIDPVTETVRGTLISASSHSAVSAVPDAVGYEWTTGAGRSSRFPTGYTGTGQAVSSVDAEEGDWLIVELGYRCFEVAATSRNGIIVVTQAVGSPDTGANETDTAGGNGWIEFSNDVLLLPRAAPKLPWTRRIKNIKFPPQNPVLGQLWPRGWGDYDNAS